MRIGKKSGRFTLTHILSVILAPIVIGVGPASAATTVTYVPYVQPGDAGPLEGADQIVVTWQTDEKTPNPNAYMVQFGEGAALNRTARAAGRVVDNYLAADPSLPVPPTSYGAHTNYTAVLRNLEPNTTYSYRVTGPGLPAGGFSAQFQTRKNGNNFSFTVMGDEGWFSPTTGNGSQNLLADFEARIVHLLYHSGTISLPGQPQRPAADFNIVTGDNVYSTGAEDNYRDFWMPVWNSDVDSVDRGAPFIRSTLNYIVAGNHDVGGFGDHVNLLATAGAAPYSAQTGGGDALAYFNNYYFPLNGPTGADPFYVFNGDTSTYNGFFFSYNGQNYSSPNAAEALRASTLVDSGQGLKRQIDHMSNYSFDYGNAHFVFLDANPAVFDAILNFGAIYAGPQTQFPPYPKLLHDWLINDLDSSDKTWKIVVYHQPAFNSGVLGLEENQMRQVEKVLEDHGVNVVYGGHEHNYQRTRPFRSNANVGTVPTSSGPPAVNIDPVFDGEHFRVPDGIIHVVEGAGGATEFDGDEPAPRGIIGIDLEDTATGTFVAGDGKTYPQGPAAWIDTHLTTTEMTSFDPNAGQGPKVTAKFKAKVFSFGHVVVEDNELTHYQISEPLLPSSSASTADPTPYGVDYYGKPLNDPIPATLVDRTTGKVVTPTQDGTPDLLDKWSIEKPWLGRAVTARLVDNKSGNYRLTVTNNSPYALNGAQVVLSLAERTSYSGPTDDKHTLVDHGRRLVITLGRIDRGQEVSADVPLGSGKAEMDVTGELRSATALPVPLRSDDEDR